MSIYRQSGLQIAVSAPLVSGGAYIGRLSSAIESYNHSIEAMGGYWSADVSINLQESAVDDWMADGLGRHIVAVGSEGLEAWAGFVNRIDVSIGGLSVTVGPLLDITNKVRSVYSLLEPTGLLKGAQFATAWAEDADSQAKYGVFESEININDTDSDTADVMAATYLAERAWPEVSKDFVTSGGTAPKVRLECLGYVHMLGVYTYEDLTTEGLDNASDIIATVIAADPNGFLSTDTSRIDTNATQIPAYVQQATAWDVIKGIVALGDEDANRWLFGIYEDRIPTYAAIPSAVEYTQRLRDQRQAVRTPTGVEVRPWQVRPGKWLQFTDLLVGRPLGEDLSTDPRVMFVESVNFDAPYTVRLQGQKAGRFDQRLARLGLSGQGGLSGVAGG